MKFRTLLVCLVFALGSVGIAQASTKSQKAASWQKTTMMHYKQMTARANGSPSPTWPHSHCVGQCHALIVQYSHSRKSAEKAWSKIRYGTDQTAVKKIIRYWFSPEGHYVLANAFTVASCENSFVASNGPSSTGDWGAWQINYSAHSRAFGSDDTSFFRVVNDPWAATMVAYRWSAHGTNFSPTWTCGTIHGIA